MLKAILDHHSPDVIGTQEALRFQLDEIRADMKKYGEIGVGRENGKNSGEYAAILYDTTQFSVKESGTFWFSDTPDKPGSATWGNRLPRICTWALLLHKKVNRGFYIYNMHLDHWSQNSRQRSISLLVHRIINRRYPCPVIITGDFNAGERNPIIKYLSGKHNFAFENTHCPLKFIDTFRHVNPRGVGGTYNLFRGFRYGPKIDFIFSDTGAEVISSNIIRTHFDGRYPSDHFPITASLKLHH